MKIGEHTYPDDPTILGEIAGLHVCECRGTIAKVGLPGTRDALMDEAMILSVLRTNCPNPKLEPYLPEPVSLGPAGDGRWANVFTYLDGFYSLEQVKEAYPDGIDARDMAWIFRRLMVVCGYAKRAGVVHGAVFPSHVMVHPEMHGLVLVDWCYGADAEDAAQENEPISLERTSIAYKNWYPQEVAKHEVQPSTDICLAAKTMVWLMGGDGPEAMLPDNVRDVRPFRNFFQALTQPDWRARPIDGWEVQRRFDELIEELWGERKFHPFSMPPKGLS